MVARFIQRRWSSAIVSICLFAMFGGQALVPRSRAQSSKTTLISQETSTRAIAVDSVTQRREPFNLTSEVVWGNDSRSRIMLFAMGLDRNASLSDLTASAQDGANHTYSLAVEYVGPVPNQDWVTSIVLRLDDQMNDLGDVLIGISYQGAKSNRVRVGIGHVGDGPPDDEGAVPTPGSLAPPVPPSATAGTLTTADVQ